MKVLFNFAHNAFYRSQELNTSTGYKIGGFDTVYQYRFNDIDSDFYNQNKHILNQPRGAGYWLWKYYFSVQLLNDTNIPENTYLFYSDAGAYFINNIQNLIDVLERDGGSIMIFRQNHAAYTCTKRDTFILMCADEPKYTQTPIRCGGWFLFKKNELSKQFFNETLQYATDYRILTDAPNEMGKPNYEGFFDHRHDESVISIMAKKYDLYPYRNPSQHGISDDVNITNNRYDDIGYAETLSQNGRFIHGKPIGQYPPVIFDTKSTYPTIITLTRNKN